jgi:hypothetical protein
MYRYEIHIPLCYNDGEWIKFEAFLETQNELLERYDGLTIIKDVQGWWRDNNDICASMDTQHLYIVDVPKPLGDEKKFWPEYKKILEDRFEQDEIYITYYEIGKIGD